jgi:hypothetical protein
LTGSVNAQVIRSINPPTIHEFTNWLNHTVNLRFSQRVIEQIIERFNDDVIQALSKSVSASVNA